MSCPTPAGSNKYYSCTYLKDQTKTKRIESTDCCAGRAAGESHLLLKLFHDPEQFPTFLALLPLCFRRPPPRASDASSSGTAALSIIPPSARNGEVTWFIHSFTVGSRGDSKREGQEVSRSDRHVCKLFFFFRWVHQLYAPTRTAPELYMYEGQTRQDMTRYDKMGQDMTRYDKTRQDTTWRDNTIQYNTIVHTIHTTQHNTIHTIQYKQIKRRGTKRQDQTS